MMAGNHILRICIYLSESPKHLVFDASSIDNRVLLRFMITLWSHLSHSNIRFSSTLAENLTLVFLVWCLLQWFLMITLFTFKSWNVFYFLQRILFWMKFWFLSLISMLMLTNDHSSRIISQIVFHFCHWFWIWLTL